MMNIPDLDNCNKENYSMVAYEVAKASYKMTSYVQQKLRNFYVGPLLSV